MTDAITFTDQIAVVTGAGGGLGRAYALELARRGAKVVVNDLGAARDGSGHSDAAIAVVAEIEAAGGVAMADGGDVSDAAAMEAMVARARDEWGGVHVVINNAGILRDRSFAKMTLDDFALVVRVHLTGSGHRDQGGVGDDARAGLWPGADDRGPPPGSTAISGRRTTARPNWGWSDWPRRWRLRARAMTSA